MTDIDQDLGERDHEEVVDFPPAERTIHTQAYDLSLNTLKEQWDDETLMIPEFQREYVWDNAKASRLVESFLLNIPVPVLYFAETPAAKYEIVDGHQRVYSLVRYMDNQFGLSGLRIQQEFKGRRFHQLPDREQRYLKTRSLRAIVIGADSHPSMKFETFERLNTGGLALNAQEIRNALNQGPLNDLITSLEKEPAFLSCLGISRPRKRMVDRELVLRYLALRNDLASYRPPLVRFLNDFMAAHADPSDAWLREQARDFQNTVERVSDTLGRAAFRVTDSAGTPTERSINKALYDAQMLTFAAADPDALKQRRAAVAANVAGLFGQDSFEDAIRRATGDRSRTLSRLRAMADTVRNAGVPVDDVQLGLPDSV